MSFPRHRRSIVRWGRPFGRERIGSWLRPRPLTVSMSRSPLFLAGLLSSSARFRFTGQPQNALQWSCRLRLFQRTANSVCFGVSAEGSTPLPVLIVQNDTGTQDIWVFQTGIL